MALGADWDMFHEPIECKSNLVDTNHWPPGGVKWVGDEGALPVTRDHLLSRSKISPHLRPPGLRAALLYSGNMSQSSQSQSKKRKQAAVTEAGGEDIQPAPKRSKHSSEKKLKKDKSKAGPSTRHGTGSGSKGEFQTITSTLNVSIPPIYAMELRRGVQEMLDGMLMRYGFW